jgi:hypothetical protein
MLGEVAEVCQHFFYSAQKCPERAWRAKIAVYSFPFVGKDRAGGPS